MALTTTFGDLLFLLRFLLLSLPNNVWRLIVFAQFLIIIIIIIIFMPCFGSHFENGRHLEKRRIAPLMVTYHYVKFYVSIIIQLEVININV
jgi:hypothetical protein